MMQLRNLILLVLMTSMANAQQAPSQVDSITRLIQRYYNESNVSALYSLGGESFKKALNENSFIEAMKGLKMQAGIIKTAEFESVTQHIARYKTTFSSGQVMTLSVGLDGTGKLSILLFQPVKEKIAVKATAAPFHNPLASSLDKQVDSLARPFIQQANTVGMAIGVWDNGKSYVYGYGETVKGNDQVPDGNTLFEIGSVTKTFTATLLAHLVETGKLKLNDPVNKYLPDSVAKLEYNGKPVTIASLSNHSSGLPRMPLNIVGTSSDNPYVKYDDGKLFAFLKRFKPYREPGAEYEYSNLAVGTLGVILERVSGKSYETLLKSNIWQPLGMKNTTITLTSADSAKFAQGYDAAVKPVHSWEFQSLAAAGAIRSNINDMLLYAAAQMNAAKKTSLHKAIQLTHQQTFAYGNNKVALGWHLLTLAGKPYIFHNGQTGGYCSVVVANPVTGKAVVILTNASAEPQNVALLLISAIDN